MGTKLNTSGPAVWIQLANAQHEVEQAASQLTTASSDTDFTTPQSSIRTTSSHVRKSTSDNSFEMNKRDSDLRQQYDQRPEKVPNIAAEMEKWHAMTDRYGFLNDNYNLDITQRVYKGIPDCWRGEAWYYLVTDRLRNTSSDCELRSTYRELLSKESPYERQIDLDIPRTLRDHIMFKQRYGSGQRALFNVLRAFASYDEEVGYCQGMTNIAATILMYCEEEKAFLILVHMFLRDGLHNLYIPGFPILMESFFIQERLLKRYMPKLYNHLADLGLSSDIYSTRWYITLFAGGVVRYHTLMRIWDAYFLCGYDLFFFVAITLLKNYESRLLASDMDTCMTLLGSTMSVPDDNSFIKHVQKLFDKNVRNGTVDKLRQEYQEKHTTI
ncbi:hypothetical protein HPULCUR_001151 [Helicostylum pulchrum]|uniref:Rab-GAP TBC domain-containing protein n=1 Tax=Helicostylum pulchrum TaxID=562976 RepID=A0ABP9XLX0_9FUNG